LLLTDITDCVIVTRANMHAAKFFYIEFAWVRVRRRRSSQMDDERSKISSAYIMT